jgi:hypothetical protein
MLQYLCSQLQQCKVLSNIFLLYLPLTCVRPHLDLCPINCSFCHHRINTDVLRDCDCTELAVDAPHNCGHNGSSVSYTDSKVAYWTT